jgi:hypothetical protein
VEDSYSESKLITGTTREHSHEIFKSVAIRVAGCNPIVGGSPAEILPEFRWYVAGANLAQFGILLEKGGKRRRRAGARL